MSRNCIKGEKWKITFPELKRFPAILHNEGNSWKHVTEILIQCSRQWKHLSQGSKGSVTPHWITLPDKGIRLVTLLAYPVLILRWALLWCSVYHIIMRYSVICCFLEHKPVKKEKSLHLNSLNKMKSLNVTGKGEIITIWIPFGKQRSNRDYARWFKMHDQS